MPHILSLQDLVFGFHSIQAVVQSRNPIARWHQPTPLMHLWWRWILFWKVGKLEDWGSDHGLLQPIKSIFLLVTPDPWLVFLGKVRQGCSDFTEPLDELLVEAAQTQERPYVSDSFWHRPINNCLDLWQGRFDTIFAHVKAKVLHLIPEEVAFGEATKKLLGTGVYPKLPLCATNVLPSYDCISKCHRGRLAQICQGHSSADYSLSAGMWLVHCRARRASPYTQMNHNVSRRWFCAHRPLSPWFGDSRRPSQFLKNTTLFMQSVHEFIHLWERVPIFRSDLVQRLIIDTETPFPVLLWDKKDWRSVRACAGPNPPLIQ